MNLSFETNPINLEVMFINHQTFLVQYILFSSTSVLKSAELLEWEENNWCLPKNGDALCCIGDAYLKMHLGQMAQVIGKPSKGPPSVVPEFSHHRSKFKKMKSDVAGCSNWFTGPIWTF